MITLKSRPVEHQLHYISLGAILDTMVLYRYTKRCPVLCEASVIA